MTLQDLIIGLDNKTITIIGKHLTGSITNQLEDRMKNANDTLLKFETELQNTNFFNFVRKSQCKFWINSAKKRLTIEIGKTLDYAQIYCFDCGDDMYLVPLSDTEFGYINSKTYWDIDYEKQDKHRFTKADITECSCCKQRAANKLTSEIDVPTGKLVIANFFTTDELFYEDPVKHFKHPTINCLLGRDNLMQELSKKNVGIGQMGNMDIAIFSNNKDEVLILDSAFKYLEAYHEDDIVYFLEEYGEETNIQEWRDLIQYIETNKFRHIDTLSLSVWRWQCADKSVLDEYKENLETLHCDNITTKVKKGRYSIEHTFGFTNSPIYSKIKKIS